MIKKEFVILVRSLKHKKYCVAGREIERVDGRVRLLENWIRPVNPSNEKGAVDEADILYSDRSQPRFLDVIQIQVEDKEDDAIQHENWVLAPGQWKKLGRVELHAVLNNLVQDPESLWLGKGMSDRITESEYFSRGYEGSMCLVEAEELEIRIFTTKNDFDNKLKRQRRAIFKYRDVEYNLPITDTDIDKRYFSDFPGLGQPVRIIKPEASRCLVAVSITPEFHGFHYKIVGNIIEI